LFPEFGTTTQITQITHLENVKQVEGLREN